MTPDFSRLEHIAELVVRRVILEVGHTKKLTEALELAYPFGDLSVGRSVWEAAILKNAPEVTQRSKAPEAANERISQARAQSSEKPAKDRSA